MQRKTLFASLASLFLAGSAAFAFAQDSAPATAPAPPAPAAAHAQPGPNHAWGKGEQGHHGWSHHGRGGESRSGVIGDLRGLERLYVMSGRQKDLPALYNDVLAKSQNPMVRQYAYRHLARAQMQPKDTDAAIATMRKSLDESLAQDQKRHEAMEAFKTRMQQRASAKSTDAK